FSMGVVLWNFGIHSSNQLRSYVVPAQPTANVTRGSTMPPSQFESILSQIREAKVRTGMDHSADSSIESKAQSLPPSVAQDDEREAALDGKTKSSLEERDRSSGRSYFELSINTRPWSKVYVRKRLLGTTPIGGERVKAGHVRLRLVDRDGHVHHRTI